MNFSLFLNISNFNDRSKSQFCVDCQYNKIKNEMSVLLIITLLRVQNNSILSQKGLYYYMSFHAFCHFFFCKKLHFIIYFEAFVLIIYNLFDCD